MNRSDVNVKFSQKKLFKNFRFYFVTLLLLFFIITTSLISIVNADASQNNSQSYISFYTDFSDDKPVNSAVDIYKIIDNKEIFEATTFSPFASSVSTKENFTLTKEPGTYDFVIKAYSEKHNLQVIYGHINGLVVKENAITYVGIHNITGAAIGTAFISYGLTQLPVTPKASDIELLTKALYDNDWATRKFAIIALTNLKVNDEQITEHIKDIAVTDRYMAVRNEAVNFLKSKKLPIPTEPFFLTNFLNKAAYWHWGGQDPVFDFTPEGYRITASNPALSVVSLKSLLMDKGFNGYNPKKLKNYDIELDCTWKSGMKNAPYGLILGNGNDNNFINPNISNFYAFCITNDGGTSVLYYKNNQLSSSPIEWNNNTSASIISHNINRLKIEIKKDQITYYVNDILIGSFKANEDYLAQCIGMGVLNKTDVCFNRLAIIKKD